MNILLTGSHGQVGSEITALSKSYPYHFFFTDRDTLDITNKVAVDNFCAEHTINVILNCAAYTAVDKAEEDAVMADAINHLAVKSMAEIAKEKENEAPRPKGTRYLHSSNFNWSSCSLVYSTSFP